MNDEQNNLHDRMNNENSTMATRLREVHEDLDKTRFALGAEAEANRDLRERLRQQENE
jgi:hypothetical protein